MLILQGFPRGSPIALTGLVKTAHRYVLRCQMGIQSGAYEYQDGCGQEDDSIVGAETERVRASTAVNAPKRRVRFLISRTMSLMALGL